MKLTIDEILKAAGGNLICKGDKEVISGISTDTRTIKKGDLFIALKGPNFDGHSFIGEAIKKGAIGAIVQSPVRQCASAPVRMKKGKKKK